MPWNEPEKWLAIPIIGAMLGLFWKSVSNKKDQIDMSLSSYVTKEFCEEKQKNISLSLTVVIQEEIQSLKDETFEYMRDIERAIREIKK